MASHWLAVMTELRRIESHLPKDWPAELPLEQTEDFWWHAQRAELQTRESVDGLIRSLSDGEAPSAISPLLGWMIRRRIEWAAQLAKAYAKVMPHPQEKVRSLLDLVLIQTWQSDGQHAFHKHSSRDGSTPPDRIFD